jgi:hypothetical protein
VALIHQWKCQDNAASTTVVATVGTNGTLEGGDNTSVLSVVDGPGTALPRSLAFNGTDDRVDIAAASLSFSSGAAFTFAAWMKLPSGSAGFLIGLSTASTNRVRTTGTALRLTTNANSDFTTNTTADGAWHHVLVSRTSGNSVRAFVDGVESSTGALTNSGFWGPNRLAYTGDGYMPGRLCDVRIYNSDESANVAAIMAEKDTAGGSKLLLRLQEEGLFVGGRAF